MGAGASVADGPEGQHVSKSQKALYDVDSYDEILAWLDWEFRKHDINKDGFLDYHEFMRFVTGLDLNLSVKEVFEFFILADVDNDYRIVWSEIIAEVPVILQKIYENSAPSSKDWCRMVTEKGESVYYNKRTSQICKIKPTDSEELDIRDDDGPTSGRHDFHGSSSSIDTHGHATHTPSSAAQHNTAHGHTGPATQTQTTTQPQTQQPPHKGPDVKGFATNLIKSPQQMGNAVRSSVYNATFPKGNKGKLDSPSSHEKRSPMSPLASEKTQSVLQNTSTFDIALTWFDWEFKKADFDQSGSLSRDEFATFMDGLKIGLSPKEVEQFAKLADANGDGAIEWSEVLELAPLILRKLYSAIEPGPHDWCMIVDAEGQMFYLNKRTGSTSYQKPAEYNPSAEELAAAMRRRPSRPELPQVVESQLELDRRTSDASSSPPPTHFQSPVSARSVKSEGSEGHAQSSNVKAAS